MRYAIERDGLAINVILADSLEIANLIANHEGATARLLADGEEPARAVETFSMPSDATINRHQAKIVLLNHGLLDQVNSIMANADPVSQIAWTEAPSFSRNSPTLLAMAAALNLTESEVDALFAEALAVNV